jgi:hypothetical protein
MGRSEDVLAWVWGRIDKVWGFLGLGMFCTEDGFAWLGWEWVSLDIAWAGLRMRLAGNGLLCTCSALGMFWTEQGQGALLAAMCMARTELRSAVLRQGGRTLGMSCAVHELRWALFVYGLVICWALRWHRMGMGCVWAGHGLDMRREKLGMCWAWARSATGKARHGLGMVCAMAGHLLGIGWHGLSVGLRGIGGGFVCAGCGLRHTGAGNLLGVGSA